MVPEKLLPSASLPNIIKHNENQCFSPPEILSEPPLVYAAESSEGEFLGYAIYHGYDERSCELGWVLKPAFWHKGYADEMTDLLTALARRAGKDAVLECVPEQTAIAQIARRHCLRKEKKEMVTN